MELVCRECGAHYWKKPYAAKKSKYCSQKCTGLAFRKIKGEQHKNWRPATHVCAQCNSPYKNHNKKSRFCSPKCFYVWQHATGAWVGRERRCCKDANEAEIISALRSHGVMVIEQSDRGWGTPDLLALFKTDIVFIEVKNPSSRYGRRGLTEHQKRFAASWQGPIYVVYTPDEALSVFGLSDARKPADVSGWREALGP